MAYSCCVPPRVPAGLLAEVGLVSMTRAASICWGARGGERRAPQELLPFWPMLQPPIPGVPAKLNFIMVLNS